LFVHQKGKDPQFNTTKFLGVTCTTDNLNTILDGFSKAYGSGKHCLYKASPMHTVNVSIAAGDFYIGQNLYYLSIYIQDTPDSDYYEGVRFIVDMNQVIFGCRLARGLVYYYELKNY
jgi:hypothetical protein